eukprot:gene8389-9287_t
MERSVVDLLLNQFLPDRYKELNIKSSNSYKQYDTRVLDFLHNRSKGVVRHIMDRFSTATTDRVTVSKVDATRFAVRSGQNTDNIWLGSEDYLPSCNCKDFKIRKLPCKHMCAVVNQPGIGWESLGISFTDHALFKLDSVVLHPSATEANNDLSASIPIADDAHAWG